MERKQGFTMIELLVVIAIIAILAAIIFPVYARTKDSAYRNSDISNMNSLRASLQLYKTDQGAYPPALLGYVTLYTSGPNAGSVIPANMITDALYPKRVTSLDTFRPAYLRGADALPATITEAVWPPSSIIGGTTTLSEQRYGPTDGVVSVDASGNEGAGFATPLQYYAVSGYDTAATPAAAAAGLPKRELRYSLFWTGFGLTTGDATDEPRQLGYSDPPDTTVITWDTYFREYDSTGLPTTGGYRDIVLFLGGSAKPMDSKLVYANAWAQMP